MAKRKIRGLAPLVLASNSSNLIVIPSQSHIENLGSRHHNKRNNEERLLTLFETLKRQDMNLK